MPVNATPAYLLAAIALAAALAGCDIKTHGTSGNETASIRIGDDDNAADGDDIGNAADADKALSIHVPGFSAKLAVPGLSLSGRTTDIDGIPLYPGTRMTGVAIDAHDNDPGGHVNMAFTAPAAPAALLDYYRNAARKAGWQDQPPAAGQQFAASKTDEDGKTAHLALALHDTTGGAAGRFTIDGN